MRIFILTLLFIFIYFTFPALSQIYRSVDKNGTVTYTDIPPTGNYEIIESNTSPTFSGSDLPTNQDSYTRKPNKLDKYQSETKKYSKKNMVDLYVTNWCPYCKKAELFFESRNIKVNIYDIERNKKARKRKEKLDIRKGVPFAVINGKKVHGYSTQLYDKYLKTYQE